MPLGPLRSPVKMTIFSRTGLASETMNTDEGEPSKPDAEHENSLRQRLLKEIAGGDDLMGAEVPPHTGNGENPQSEGASAIC